ncbi:ATP-binding cassette sub-family A member 3 isoform X1 [Drosophila subpulchrella]|uniref:ATP-binding cassette sub-family A member 3 isoform X1 n=1 Tax=Drosophila subpulchrella TaxID=1486046 RepID=UPI0018A16746|nr:ATP-binding cassette sub-family A member 3 isoform X1 [Drosophila subpulchrella]XP_037723614.1 ATP-binding cassette sub-family A member 3 isoform X1 [Drosophila subpulchrella]XP_037723615.1 ATP-binding cassette sub-family A member 3 isoform X1 [Drosophila subpulchrella]
MAKVTNWDKFVLLLWKNWTLQWNHKWQMVIELVLPAIFSLLLVLVRTLVDTEQRGIKTYDPQNLTDLSLLQHSLHRSSYLGKLIALIAPNRRSGLSNFKFTVCYSPVNPVLKKLVDEAWQSLGMKDVCESQNATQLQVDTVSQSAFAGIQFDDAWANLTESDDLPDDFHFALRFPSELRTATMAVANTWLTMRLFPTIDLTGPRNEPDQDGGIPPGYLREGFLPLQHSLSMAYIRQKSGEQSLPEVKMQRYPYPAYIYDPLLEGMSSIMSLIILLSFIYPCTYITKYITAEKEKQLKEVMKIMGLSNWLHWTAWFVKSFIMLTISAILIAILVKINWTEGVAVLTHANFTALVFFLIIYIIASICFCFMMATFFSRASTAAAVTGLIWFIAYIPYSFTINTYDDLSLTAKLGWSLVSNTAMGFGIKLILGFEGTGEGLQWSNFFTPVSVDDTLTLGAVMIMMLVSCAICMTICLYVEQVMPGSFGVPRPWNFPFTREFWCGEREYTGVEDIPNGHVEQRDPKAFETEPEGKHIGLQMRHLKKRFADKMVVKGLSMNMFEDEITVLLGHNGAGKTTTISMLTGMFPPTSGTAIINGSDIRTNIEGARMSLGICPQHNVLFDEMSVSNHIRFFSRMKGLRGKAVEQEVAKYLKMIELEDKANVASVKLSGGMKRKLSVCCALCGDTKVVLCDEPSSGMDPSARRQLWDLLQQEKVGRTLLLTTHFMDEADVLGDRIAIMCDGELKCHGTSFFLKKQYGSGYRLICVKRDDCETNEVTALLNKYIPGLKPECDIGAELSYQLPDSASSKFEEMFGQLEDQSDELHLNGYGVGITSMEEVFMKVGAEKDSTGNLKDQSEIMNGGSGFRGEDDNESVQSDGIFSENRRLLQGFQLLSNQWKAMLLKKFLYTWRNKLLLLIQNIMPVFFVVVTILIIETQGTFQELKPITMSLTQYPLAVTVLDRSQVVSGSNSSEIANKYAELAESYGSNYGLELTGTKGFEEYILDLGKTIQVRINSRYLVAATINESMIIAWLNNQALHTAPLTVNMVHNAIADRLMGSSVRIAVTNAPLPYTTNTLLSQLSMGNNLGTQLASNLCFCMCFVSSIYILFLIKERESRAKLLQFVGGVKVWTFWLSQFICDFATYIVTALIVVITIVCFQEPGLSSFGELGRYYLLLLLFGFAVLPFIYIMSLFFKEPATGFARVSIINIFCGMALFIVVVVMSSELFDTKDTADILGWIFRIFPHFSLAMSLNKVYTNTATRNACAKAGAIPPILLCELVPQCCNIKPFFAWEEPGVLPETIYMTVTGVVFFLIIIVLEFRLINELMFKIRLMLSKPPPPPAEGHLDDDVANERERIIHMSSDELVTKNLVLDRVTKYYGQFLAVNQVSLCVQEVECFGLLGVNGAGKTTTFKMMTGDERISSGAAFVQGLSLESNMNSIYKMIGYCPQFDALLDDLTGREVLRIFCMLRGVQEARIRQLSEDLAKSFGFMKHIDKQTHAYSGGNKRKLSTAIAVIGSPSVIYLDEPTTGMDPAARRQLWNMVCRIRDSGKSIVLTSHSMEECEALCTRLAIMVNGEFKCIGSTQHLKNKFSKGLILKIKVRRNLEALRQARLSGGYARNPDEQTVPAQMAQQDIDAVKEFVEHEYPHSILQEEYQGILTFYIPLTGVKWSRIFGLMESNRDQLNVEDYSVSQTTLEEIFLEFAKYQREDTRANHRLSELRKLCKCLLANEY